MFTCLQCGRCCYNVPVMDWQLEEIKEELKEISPRDIQRYRSQSRPSRSCPLRDVKSGQCIIYKMRPMVCQQYGYFESMECPNNLSFPVRPKDEGFLEYRALGGVRDGEKFAGVLGFNITWRELLK